MLVSALGHPRLAVAVGAAAIVVIVTLPAMDIMPRSASSAIASGGPADETRALGWMACANAAYFNRSLTNLPVTSARIAAQQRLAGLSFDLGPLPRVQGRLSEEPTAKRRVDVNQWSVLRQAVAADQARLNGINRSGSAAPLVC